MAVVPLRQGLGLVPMTDDAFDTVNDGTVLSAISSMTFVEPAPRSFHDFNSTAATSAMNFVSHSRRA